MRSLRFFNDLAEELRDLPPEVRIIAIDGRCAAGKTTLAARLVKEHNNANIIAFGARIVGTELAKDIVKAYLDAEFLGGRHQTRIDMIHEIEVR